MDTRDVSAQIMERLVEEAKEFDKPCVRLASLDRLKQACDAIESGIAADAYKVAFGTDGELRRNAKITPSNIEKYVRSRRKNGDKEWTGPTRVFIASDKNLNSYVLAREDQRAKPFSPRRPSDRQKEIEDAIAQLPTPEIRQTIRFELEDGRLAKRRLDILSRGLRLLPGIDVDDLLAGGTGYPRQVTGFSANAEAIVDPNAVSESDKVLIRSLVQRLGDSEEMARAGLQIDGLRLKMSFSPGTTIIRPDEMAALRRSGGLAEN